ncbi:hypothetical protein KUTeg_019446 [Tegillarca granosa]|uniref:Uncharacterized protein n=1 Tax=Tegillarca granosa TaxID=220873 RepID=A0ABQ9ECZ9_TEGGR|nr:hypothetical protein KUTeg_019446 [Tegillarca granosa]
MQRKSRNKTENKTESALTTEGKCLQNASRIGADFTMQQESISGDKTSGLSSWTVNQITYERCYVNCMQSIRDALCMTFCPCCVYDRFRHLKKLEVPRSPWKRLCRDGTFENEMLACFLGFLGGVLMTMFIYFVMTMQLEFQPMIASIVCSVLGIFITFGMAFSQRWRCVTLLMIPQLFSIYLSLFQFKGNGRSFILLYIMILVMTHPVVNFNRNIMVMSNTATCGQQLAYNQTKELVESATAPLALKKITIMGTIKSLMNALTEFSNSLRESFKALKKAVEEISNITKKTK